MRPLGVETAKACDVRTTADEMSVSLLDGRRVTVPLAWFLRLLHATPRERRAWELVGDGERIHWPSIDEDEGVIGLLEGPARASSVNPSKKWLSSRAGQARPRKPSPARNGRHRSRSA
jgi:hypothetical protein